MFRLTKESQAILQELLDRYESSKLFREGCSNQRVYLKFGKCKNLTSRIRDVQEKRLFLAALEELKELGVADFTWVRYEKGNLVDTVYLTNDVKLITQCYEALGRIPKQQMLDDLEGLLQDAIKSTRDSDSDLGLFFQEMAEAVVVRREIPRFFFRIGSSDALARNYAVVVEKNRNLLRFLSSLTEGTNGQQEQMERVLSAALFGDSKYFEKELKSKVLSILRYMHEERGEDSGNGRVEETVTDDQLLAERGVVKWPEILEFCGNIKVYLDDGTVIDYSGQRYGAYINARTVHHVRNLCPAASANPISRVLSIENKANYTWYLENKKSEGELVLYHGGAYSPVKGQWFCLVEDSLKNIPVYHWSDIDLGGFYIFLRLKKNVFPKLLPWQMDLNTMQENRERCMYITSDTYLQELKKRLDDPDFEIFHEVIRYMLEEQIRLEQEQLISF